MTEQNESISSAGHVPDAQQLLTLCVDRMPFAYILWGPDQRVLDWNPAAARIFGWSLEEARGREARELMLQGPDSHPDCLREAFCRADGETTLKVCRGISKGGKKLACEWHNTPLRDAAGKGLGVLSMVHDITDRDQVEQELRESRKLFQTIIDSEPECVKLLNRDGTLIMMNRAGLDMIEADSLEQVKGPVRLPPDNDPASRPLHAGDRAGVPGRGGVSHVRDDRAARQEVVARDPCRAPAQRQGRDHRPARHHPRRDGPEKTPKRS